MLPARAVLWEGMKPSRMARKQMYGARHPGAAYVDVRQKAVYRLLCLGDDARVFGIEREVQLRRAARRNTDPSIAQIQA